MTIIEKALQRTTDTKALFLGPGVIVKTAQMFRELFPDAKKASVPIVAVTANACERDRKLAMESGMDAFTEKPFFMDRLFETMKQFLS